MMSYVAVVKLLCRSLYFRLAAVDFKQLQYYNQRHLWLL